LLSEIWGHRSMSKGNGTPQFFPLLYPNSLEIRNIACHATIFGFVFGHDSRRLPVTGKTAPT
jgi:hypothetical protein